MINAEDEDEKDYGRLWFLAVLNFLNASLKVMHSFIIKPFDNQTVT